MGDVERIQAVLGWLERGAGRAGLKRVGPVWASSSWVGGRPGLTGRAELGWLAGLGVRGVRWFGPVSGLGWLV